MECMQASSGSEQVKQARAAGNNPPETDEPGQHKLPTEDWVTQEGSSTPKDTSGTLIQKFNAALQVLQMVSDEVSLQ